MSDTSCRGDTLEHMKNSSTETTTDDDRLDRFAKEFLVTFAIFLAIETVELVIGVGTHSVPTSQFDVGLLLAPLLLWGLYVFVRNSMVLRRISKEAKPPPFMTPVGEHDTHNE